MATAIAHTTPTRLARLRKRRHGHRRSHLRLASVMSQALAGRF
jgi:hypothetical protein